MKLLVIGSGGREHAIAWKLARSPRVQKVFVAPGNGGTATESGLENVPLEDLGELIAFARAQGVQLTVVGPEGPLAAGVVDAFREAGLRIFGPTRAAAQLEASKDFAKSFMAKHGIPTAQHRSFLSADLARAYIAQRGAPIVVKADGLAAGKGVVVAQSVAEAQAAVERMMLDKSLGAAGARLVVEDYLEGEEASFIVMTDGVHVLPLATSQDHKRLRDGDAGPNTGGMGAYSPKGDPIAGIPAPTAECRAFHAGTRLEGERLLTNGGRVLCVTALGDSVRIARTRAYAAVERIRFEGMQYRGDIGHRALKKA